MTDETTETPPEEQAQEEPDAGHVPDEPDAEALKEERDGTLDDTTDPNLPRTEGGGFADGEAAGPFGGGESDSG